MGRLFSSAEIWAFRKELLIEIEHDTSIGLRIYNNTIIHITIYLGNILFFVFFRMTHFKKCMTFASIPLFLFSLTAFSNAQPITTKQFVSGGSVNCEPDHGQRCNVGGCDSAGSCHVWKPSGEGVFIVPVDDLNDGFLTQPMANRLKLLGTTYFIGKTKFKLLFHGLLLFFVWTFMNRCAPRFRQDSHFDDHFSNGFKRA